MRALSNAQAQRLIKKIQALPPESQAEIEDFIDFLYQRDDSGHLVKAGMALAQPILDRIWDNPEDAAYDNL